MGESPLVLLGRRIARLRKERREWSQDQLALETEISRSYIALVETGQTNITYLKLRAIAAALGMTVAELVDVENSISKSTSSH